jgi:toxin CcdB
MAQFDVYPNPEPSQKGKIPFLLDLQCDLLHGLNTTVVAPLYDLDVTNRLQVRGVTPVFEVEGRKVVMVIPELAGVPVRRLPPKIGSLANERSAIVAAIDFLFTGS